MIYIVLLFAILFMSFVVYTLYSNYKTEQDRERKRKIARYKELISETDELLLNPNHLPYTKTLVLMLQNRILSSLNGILECNPTLNSVRTRTADIKKQIDFVTKNYTTGEDNPFVVPANDPQAIQMLKCIKKLRKLLRIEHNRGKIDPNAFLAEDSRLESLQTKVNVTSLLSHLQNAKNARQWGTCKQLITMGTQVIKSIAKPDAWLEGKLEELHQINDAVNAEIAEINKQDMQQLKRSESDELDELFQPKKKW